MACRTLVQSRTGLVSSYRPGTVDMVCLYACEEGDAKTDSIIGMPRILLSTAHVVPAVLDLLGVAYTAPPEVAASPPLPEPYKVTRKRVEALQKVDTDAKFKGSEAGSIESSKKPFCVDVRQRLGLQA